MKKSRAFIKITGPETVRRLEAAADRMRPRIRDAYLRGLRRIRERMSDEDLAGLLEARGTGAISRLLGADIIEESFQEVQAAMSAAVVEGGTVAASVQEPVIGANGTRVDFVFDVANPRTGDFARRMTSQRIREISEDVRAVVRQTITEGVVAGQNPIDTARTVRQTVGLTQRQTQMVTNFRQLLEQGDPAALERALRDRRFDASVRRLIDGQTLSPEKIDRMVERFREKLLRYRSEVIARTESTRAIQGGQHEFIRQQIDEGRINEEQVRRFWHTAQDEKVRSSHRLIPAMNDAGVRQDEPFDTPLGPLMFPGDPAGTAANTIQCRCTVFSRIVSAELLEDVA